ncbi:hypothetical protein CONPUDRAFT_148155 [Coniophora puteana RWD-64-598 SS2]|uniref:Uncharacterized protein n=1 Tax=Coniophora puteana (strain RWD-64-598) TaxID=741705 RepID=A0A5M3N3T8_CONPW|nr:uncharacterized protein CONPUDRAFT_148155 [Coniophora puteana RWD-64-598 SS2]EIW86033.1 hypothetical protein CONPUDRAFT_148155 [Coniophora puteana RWD-64-598 SS2]
MRGPLSAVKSAVKSAAGSPTGGPSSRRTRLPNGKPVVKKSAAPQWEARRQEHRQECPPNGQSTVKVAGRFILGVGPFPSRCPQPQAAGVAFPIANPNVPPHVGLEPVKGALQSCMARLRPGCAAHHRKGAPGSTCYQEPSVTDNASTLTWKAVSSSTPPPPWLL